MNLRSTAASIIVVAGGFGLYFACQPHPSPGPVIESNHDEPIIIENGPVRMHFNPLRNTATSGALNGDFRFIRPQTKGLVAARFWRGDQPVTCSGADCYQGTGNTTWAVKGQVTITLRNGSVLTLDHPAPTQTGRITLDSSKHQKKMNDRGTRKRGRATIELADLDEQHYVRTVTIAPSVTVDLRPDGDYTVPVRVAFCATVDEEHCPRYEDWP